jgi:hypothetical protein
MLLVAIQSQFFLNVAIQNQAKKRLMTSIITYVTCGHLKSKSGHPKSTQEN